MTDGPGLPGGVPPPRGPWETWRARLDVAGFRPARRFGQNFLVDDARCAAIAALGEPLAGAFVLEVGVGLGFLTRHLLARGARVVGVEVDPRLVEIVGGELAELAASAHTSFEWVVGDVLDGKSRLAPAVVERVPREGPWQLVSNLPYAVASPVVALAARLDPPPEAMTVLVQLEVAQRLAAAPASADYGALSVRVQASHDARVVLRVPPGAFRPRPNVDSAVVRLVRRGDGPDAELAARVDAVSAAAFSQRRKRLRNTLGAALESTSAAEEVCRAAGVDPGARAEELDRAAFLALAAVWPRRAGGEAPVEAGGSAGGSAGGAEAGAGPDG